MVEKRFARYFVFTDSPSGPAMEFDDQHPSVKRITRFDGDCLPGTEFYNECVWVAPDVEAGEEIVLTDAHSHGWDQEIGCYCLNFDNLHDLGSEVAITIDGETHLVTESFTAFIPAGTWHGPLVVRNVTHPLLVFSAGPTARYDRAAR